MNISFLWKHAGAITIWWLMGDKDWTVHVLPSPQFWEIGVTKYWCDGPTLDIACGPALRVIRHG